MVADNFQSQFEKELAVFVYAIYAKQPGSVRAVQRQSEHNELVPPDECKCFVTSNQVVDHESKIWRLTSYFIEKLFLISLVDKFTYICDT